MPTCEIGEHYKGSDIIENILKKLVSQEQADIPYPIHAEETWYVLGLVNDQSKYGGDPGNVYDPTTSKFLDVSQNLDSILAITDMGETYSKF